MYSKEMRKLHIDIDIKQLSKKQIDILLNYRKIYILKEQLEGIILYLTNNNKSNTEQYLIQWVQYLKIKEKYLKSKSMLKEEVIDKFISNENYRIVGVRDNFVDELLEIEIQKK